MTNVTGFTPYFYVAVPRGFTVDDLNDFANHVNVSDHIAFLTVPNRASCAASTRW